MTDLEGVWHRDEPESPCMRVCVIHPESGLCLGCLRNRDEIAAWGRLTADERRAVLARLPERAPLIKPRRRGRKKRPGLS